MDNVNTPRGIRKYIPILGWLPRYQTAWLRLDLVAAGGLIQIGEFQSMAQASRTELI